jgi:hypothetical protein
LTPRYSCCILMARHSAGKWRSSTLRMDTWGHDQTPAEHRLDMVKMWVMHGRRTGRRIGEGVRRGAGSREKRTRSRHDHQE